MGNLAHPFAEETSMFGSSQPAYNSFYQGVMGQPGNLPSHAASSLYPGMFQATSTPQFHTYISPQQQQQQQQQQLQQQVE